MWKRTKPHAIWAANPDDLYRVSAQNQLLKSNKKAPKIWCFAELMWKFLGKPTSPVDYSPNKADLWHSAF